MAGVARDARSHRLRTLVADAVGVPAAAVVDVDVFSATAAAALLPSAVPDFREGLDSSALARAVWQVASAELWSPLLLWGRRRAEVSGPAAAAAAASLCRRRMEAKFAQLAGRDAMPPHLRAALLALVAGFLDRSPVLAADPPPPVDLAADGGSAFTLPQPDAPCRDRVALPEALPSAPPNTWRASAAAGPPVAAHARGHGPHGLPAPAMGGPHLGRADLSAGGRLSTGRAARGGPRNGRRRLRHAPAAPDPRAQPALPPVEQRGLGAAARRERATSAAPHVAAVGTPFAAGRRAARTPAALSRAVEQLLAAVPMLGGPLSARQPRLAGASLPARPG